MTRTDRRFARQLSRMQRHVPYLGRTLQFGSRLRALTGVLLILGGLMGFLPVLGGLVGLLGLLLLAIALRVWTQPLALAATLGLSADSLLGVASLRADLGGFFGAGGLFALLAALRADRRWLVPAMVLLGLALLGRIISFVASGGGVPQVPPMILEALMLGILAFGWRVLRPPAAGSGGDQG